MIRQRIYDFIAYHGCNILMGIIFTAIVAVFVFGPQVKVVSDKTIFMEECEQFHLKFECTAMWRAGRSLL